MRVIKIYTKLIILVMLYSVGFFSLSIVSSASIKNQNSFDVWVKKNDSLKAIFKRYNLSIKNLYTIINIPEGKKISKIYPGQRIHFEIEGNKTIKKMIIYSKGNLITEVSKKGLGKFSIRRNATEERKIYRVVKFKLYHTVYLDGKKKGLSIENIKEITNILDKDGRLSVKRLQPGSDFSVVLEKDIWDSKPRYKVSFIDISHKKKSWTVTKYQEKGNNGFFHDNGEQMQTSFLKYPLSNFHISSHFSLNRKHPVYKTKRPHYGVDLASRSGSPVWSTAEGTVVFAGTKGGYGRTVIIQHDKHYRTIYAHLSRFQKGLAVGKKVNQKQVIGFVGSTGVATGPHLHYEIRKDGVAKNPLTIELPSQKRLKGKDLLDFKKIQVFMKSLAFPSGFR